MSTDITRSTFHRERHFSSVRKQQGRVDIDADFNEASDIQLHLERTANKDIIGRAGGPEGNAGFEITSPDGSAIKIGAGRYYVDGILVENENDVDYVDQIDLPFLKSGPNETEQEKAERIYGAFESGRYLFYLDVWERPITWLEDESIREVALGGPDHGTRTKVIAQVRAERLDSDDHPNPSCGDFDGEHWAEPKADSHARLAARSTPVTDPDNACEVPASAGYRGPENQLYRVEIREEGGLGTAKFAWSRENASVVSRLEKISDDRLTLTISGYHRDENLNFDKAKWVEVIDDERELRGEPGTFVAVDKVEDEKITLSAALPAMTLGTNLRVRRWDDETGLRTVTSDPLVDEGYLVLEQGIQVKFTSVGDPFDGDVLFRVGEYWLIPARTNKGDIEWPKDETAADPKPPLALGPMGIKHHYARLALADLNDGAWTIPNDCRCIFPPLCDLPVGDDCCCCEITVGDGKTSHGDFDDLYAAIASLNGTNLRHHICLLPGMHLLEGEPLSLRHLRIKLSGCGNRSPIINPNGAVLKATNCEIEIDGIHAWGSGVEGTITLSHCKMNSYVHDSAVINHSGYGTAPEIILPDFKELPDLSLPDNFEQPWPALDIIASQGLRVERNLIHGKNAIQFTGDSAVFKDNTLSGGGILCVRFEPWSGEIAILDNNISSGVGPGICYEDRMVTSGGLPPDGVLIIRGNRINRMRGNGIMAFTSVQGKVMHPSKRVEITGNTITECCRVNTDQLCGGIIWEAGEEVLIARNRVIDCAVNMNPVVGILVRRTSGATITENVVEGNGISTQGDKVGQFQAGIAALHVLPGKAEWKSDNKNPAVPTHAVKVHGNTVSTPAGPAVWALGIGPMSVSDNTLVSQGVYKQAYDYEVIHVEQTVWDLAQRGSVISVLNIGLALEFNAPVASNASDAVRDILTYMSQMEGLLRQTGFGRIPGSVQCTDNQVHFSCEVNDAGIKNLSNTFIVSLDDVRLQDNTIRCDLRGSQTFANRVYALTAGIGGNRFQEGSNEVNASLLAIAGWLNMTDNIATHCLIGLVPTAARKKIDGNLIMLNDQQHCDKFAGTMKEVSGILSEFKNWPTDPVDPAQELNKFLEAIFKA